jgi:hypothetical protein
LSCLSRKSFPDVSVARRPVSVVRYTALTCAPSGTMVTMHSWYNIKQGHISTQRSTHGPHGYIPLTQSYVRLSTSFSCHCWNMNKLITRSYRLHNQRFARTIVRPYCSPFPIVSHSSIVPRTYIMLHFMYILIRLPQRAHRTNDTKYLLLFARLSLILITRISYPNTNCCRATLLRS